MADLTDVINSSIADAGIDGDGAVTESAEAPDAAVTAETEQPETTQSETVSADAQPATPPAEPHDELLTEHFAGNKNNRIPYTRVRAILDNARKKHEAEVAQHVSKAQQFEQERAGYSQQLQALRVAEENPEQFLRAIAQADPRYAKILSRVFEAAQPETPSSSAQKPEPDLLLADGTLSYSHAALERLADWKAQQRVSELEQRYAERFGPIEQEYRAQAHIRAVVPKVQAQIAEAESWPLFTESKADILATLKADRSLSLDAAYRKVVFPKLQANRDTMRSELLKEINAKPRGASSAIPATSGKAPVQAGPREIEDVIRESIASLA
jgi:hypothetical protein